MSDPNNTTPAQLQAFVLKLRENFVELSDLPTVQAMQEFDENMRPFMLAQAEAMHRQAAADMPSQAEMLMELVLEVEQAVSLVPPRLRRYRDLLAAEGLDKTVVAPAHAPGPGGSHSAAEGGREGLPGINLADQAALEFHSQLLQVAFGIAQDEVQQRMQQRLLQRFQQQGDLGGGRA